MCGTLCLLLVKLGANDLNCVDAPLNPTHSLTIIRAARCDNTTAALMFCRCFFLFFFLFSARSPRSLGRSPRNIATWSEIYTILKTRSKIWGPPRKIWGPKNMLFSAQFRTTSHFDREYLRNGTRYRQSENGVANYDLSRDCWRNLVNFGPQTAKNRTVVCAHPIAST